MTVAPVVLDATELTAYKISPDDTVVLVVLSGPTTSGSGTTVCFEIWEPRAWSAFLADWLDVDRAAPGRQGPARADVPALQELEAYARRVVPLAAPALGQRVGGVRQLHYDRQVERERVELHQGAHGPFE